MVGLAAKSFLVGFAVAVVLSIAVGLYIDAREGLWGERRRREPHW